MTIEKKRRSGHRTQWAAQFAVASELCKKGYEVALTMGNHPTADLMVYSPGGKAFVIDVKGQYKRNWWVVSEKPEREDAFYVFALVPDEGSNRFFVLTQAEVNTGIRGVRESKGGGDRKGAVTGQGRGVSLRGFPVR